MSKLAARGLLISECFRSIQGEGPYMGWPATFIRLGYCNLRCTWCDAWYTWDQSRVDLKSTLKRLAIDRAVLMLLENDDPLVVITGGEPLLQQEALLEIREILTEQYEWYSVLQFETNGTILPDPLWDQRSTHYWIVSPKLSNNGRDSEQRRINPKAIEFFAEGRGHFKFVISKPSDLEEVQDFVDKYKIRRDRVYVMPEGRDAQELNKRALWLVDACKQTGWKYSDRLHIRLYGDRRGT